MNTPPAKTTATALAYALAVSSATLPALAAPSGSYLCFKPASGQTSYPWETVSWWYTGTSGSAPNAAALPTSSDNVFHYSSKNDVSSSSGKPMVVGNGVTAETKTLTICDTASGNNARRIGIEVQDGGTMVTAGKAFVGDVDGAAQKVRLFHWDGSSWTSVGRAEGEDMPHVETTVQQPAYTGTDADGRIWNIGWYAAALVRNGSFTLIIR